MVWIDDLQRGRCRGVPKPGPHSRSSRIAAIAPEMNDFLYTVLIMLWLGFWVFAVWAGQRSYREATPEERQDMDEREQAGWSAW